METSVLLLFFFPPSVILKQRHRSAQLVGNADSALRGMSSTPGLVPPWVAGWGTGPKTAAMGDSLRRDVGPDPSRD